MNDPHGWNWDLSDRDLPVSWSTDFQSVHEFQASPDGERIAAIVKTGDTELTACVNGTPWDERFEKMWYLRYSPDGRLTALGCTQGEWTLVVDGHPWESRFAYAWDTRFSADGRRIAISFQQDMAYGMACDDVPWDTTYPNMTHPVMDARGRTAGVVQTEPLNEGDIQKYQQGIYTMASDGTAWGRCFVNLWKSAFSADGSSLAAEARITLHDYTIVVDGQPWPQTFGGVWEPVFHPVRGTVAAPVRTQGRWTVAEDGREIWDRRFVQVWHATFSPDGRRLAAIVAPKFGRWTVAVDGSPWPVTVGDMVTDLVFSPDGSRIAAAVKDRGRWTLAADGRVWTQTFDMVRSPVFSPDGRHVAATVQRDGATTVAVNDRVWSHRCDLAWDPAFSPDGSRILLRTVEGGTYFRRVLAVTDITG